MRAAPVFLRSRFPWHCHAVSQTSELPPVPPLSLSSGCPHAEVLHASIRAQSFQSFLLSSPSLHPSSVSAYHRLAFVSPSVLDSLSLMAQYPTHRHFLSSTLSCVCMFFCLGLLSVSFVSLFKCISRAIYSCLCLQRSPPPTVFSRLCSAR